MTSMVPCRLCGLPVKNRTATSIENSDQDFCCQGCRMVHTMIMESEEYRNTSDFKSTDLYKRCLAAGIVPAGAEDIPPAGDEASDPADGPDEFIPASDSDGLLSCNFSIGNMWCPACAWIVEDAMQRMNGVVRARCNFSSDRGNVLYDPVRTTPAAVFKTIEELGYSVSADPAAEGRPGPEFIRLCVCAILTMNTMMLSWAVYSGFWVDLSPESIRLLAWPVFIMATIVVSYGGGPIHKRALAGILAGAPGMETLISTGSLSAYFYSLYNFINGSLHLYFDTASMLIVLILIGKMLEQRARNRITSGFREFFSLAPRKVRLCGETFPQGRYVSIEQLERGDFFLAGEGEILAADGRVVDGLAVVDESSLTGEPKPINIRPEDVVKCGARIVSGSVRVEALRIGDRSVYGKMLAAMEAGLSSRTRQAFRFERLLKYFVPSIISISALTVVLSLFFGLPTQEAFNRGLSVMVISCPCALGLAIPLALTAGVSMAGRLGILVRDPEAFEGVETIDCIVFDKTGTLTSGRMRLLDVQALNPYTRPEVMALARGLERDSSHFIAHTLNSEGRRIGAAPVPVDRIHRHPNGISGRYQGREMRIGERSFALAREDGPVSEGLFDSESDGDLVVTRVYLSVNGKPAARFTLGDCVRDGMKELLTALDKQGRSVFMVSGDSRRAVRAAARILGIPDGKARGRMLPHEKADYITSLVKDGHRVAMVGDGINDAPAMSAADLAVAVSSGLEPGRGVAAIALMREDPFQILDFVALARRVNRKVRQNLGFAFLYNLIAIPVAACGWLNPIVAATAMLLSSLSVTINTLLLINKQIRLIEKESGIQV